MSSLDKALERASSQNIRRDASPDADARRDHPTPAMSAAAREDGTDIARGWVSTLRPPTHRAAHWDWPTVTSDLLTSPRSPLGVIASHVQDVMTRRQQQTLAVVGTACGAGCSTLVLTLARCLSEQQPVLIVDANFEQPRLAQQLGLINPARGLWEVLTGAAPLASALLTLGPASIRILPLLSRVPDECLEQHWPALQRLLAVLPCLDEYSLILVDGGTFRPRFPWGAAAVQSIPQITRPAIGDSAPLIAACEAAGIGLLGTVESCL